MDTIFSGKENPSPRSGGRLEETHLLTKQDEVWQAMIEVTEFADSIARNSTNLIYIVDLNTMSLVYSNRRVEEFLGYVPLEIPAGVPFPFDPTSTDDVPACEDHYARFNVLPEDGVIEFEQRIKNRNGEWRWLWHRETVFKRDVTGRVYQIMGTAQDITERHELEERLRTSEERLAMAMAVTEDGLWDWNITTGTLTVNHQWLAMLGYSESEFSGTIAFWEPLCHPEDLPEAQLRLARVFRDEAPLYELEHRLRHRDGHYIWVLGRGRVVARHTDGSPLRMVGTNVNITARKTAEAERVLAELRLRESETRLRQTVESVRLGLWDWNITTGYCYLDPGWSAILGYAPGELPYHLDTWKQTLHPDDIERVYGVLNAHLADANQMYEVDYRAFRKDGSIVWILTRGSVVEWDVAGTPCRMMGTIEDITERKRQEEARRESEERFRSAIDAMHDGLVIQNRHGEIVVCNRRAETILGLSAEQLAGRTSLDPRWQAIHPDGTEWPGATHPISIALRQGVSTWDALMGIHKPNGVLTWISINTAPLFSEGETEPHGAVATFADVTERRRLEAEKERLMTEAIERANRVPLTNLFNHRTFHHRVHQMAENILQGIPIATPNAVPQDRRAASPRYSSLAVAVMDMDNFKFFNDTYGHLVGDEVLCQVANALRACCRAEDVIARVGGDEFAILMPHVSRTEAATWTTRLRRCTSALSYQPPGDAAPIPLRLAIGVAVFPDEAASINDAVELADKRAMNDKAGESGEEDSHYQAERLRTRLTREVEGFSMLDALVAAVDGKDRYTRRHSEHVMRYATLIAQALSLPEMEVTSLQIAALIHDVGKIGVPNKVLRRPGALSQPEFEAIRQAPLLSSLLVGAVPELAHTLDAVKHLYERWDGNGYPCRLRGEDIPRPARILAVADAYSAMTTNRPYRRGMPSEEAFALLCQGAGVQWDAECVEALIHRLRDS